MARAKAAAASECGSGSTAPTTTKAIRRASYNVCDELECSKREECAPAAGGGVYCADNPCESDDDCPISRLLQGRRVHRHACEAGTRRCDDAAWWCARPTAGMRRATSVERGLLHE